MAKLSIEARIAQLEARKKSLQAKLGKQERARDTRRKILIGALVLDHLTSRHGANVPDHFNAQGSFTDWLKRELPGFLTREDDRALFPEFITPKPASDLTPASAAVSFDGDDMSSGHTAHPSEPDRTRSGASVNAHS